MTTLLRCQLFCEDKKNINKNAIHKCLPKDFLLCSILCAKMIQLLSIHEIVIDS